MRKFYKFQFHKFQIFKPIAQSFQLHTFLIIAIIITPSLAFSQHGERENMLSNISKEAIAARHSTDSTLVCRFGVLHLLDELEDRLQFFA